MKLAFYIPVIHTGKTARMYTACCLGTLQTSHRYSVWVDDSDEGLSYKWNRGLEWADGVDADYCFIINNDIEHRPETIDKMVKFAGDNQKISLISCAQVKNKMALQTWQPSETYLSSDFNWSYFMCHPRELLDMGGFDEEIGQGPFQDVDMQMRLNEEGKKNVRYLGACVLHYSNSVAKENLIEDYEDVYNANKNYIENKWGITL